MLLTANFVCKSSRFATPSNIARAVKLREKPFWTDTEVLLFMRDDLKAVQRETLSGTEIPLGHKVESNCLYKHFQIIVSTWVYSNSCYFLCMMQEV